MWAGKKKRNIILAIVCILFITAGCGRNNASSLETRHEEWVDSIGILSLEHSIIWYFNETAIDTDMFIKSEDEEAYKELGEVINAHNTFVEEHPDYFSADETISIASGSAGTDMEYVFFNNDCKYFDLAYYGDHFENTDTAKMQYALIYLKRLDYVMAESDSKFDVPIVVLSYDHVELPSEDIYAVLKNFSGLEQVIIDYSGMEYDPELVSASIHKYAPGVKVFDGKSASYVK